jgi:hypothetical protein
MILWLSRKVKGPSRSRSLRSELPCVRQWGWLCAAPAPLSFSDPSTTDRPDSHEDALRIDGPFIREQVPGPQREIDQALKRVIFLLARISRERQALANTRMSLEQSLDFLTEEVLDLAWFFGLVVSDFEDDELEQMEKDLDPRHFYAAYIFDQAHERREDIATVIEQAQQLGYPARYWWLSQAVELEGGPDRLSVCVHHPSSAEDAGMDLYEALEERQVTWDGLEAAVVDEYRLLGRPVEGLEGIYGRDGTPLFPPATGESPV